MKRFTNEPWSVSEDGYTIQMSARPIAVVALEVQVNLRTNERVTKTLIENLTGTE